MGGAVRREVVLGGGIAGLVWAFYHPGSEVVADEPGGAMSSASPLGPRYLHATPATKRFLDAIGLACGPVRTLRSVLEPADEPEWRRAYALKTRGVAVDGEPMLVPEHSVFDVPTVRDVVERLRCFLGDRIVRGRVTSVSVNAGRVELSDGRMMQYDRLVSTVALPDFTRLLSAAPPFGGAFLSVPVRFERRWLHGRWAWSTEYVYFAHPSVPFSRVTKLEAMPTGSTVCVEYPGVDASALCDPSEYSPFCFGPVESESLVRHGRVITRKIDEVVRLWLGVRGIELFGRLAEWDDGVLAHDLIARAEAGR